jgi:hypothetical protein
MCKHKERTMKKQRFTNYLVGAMILALAAPIFAGNQKGKDKDKEKDNGLMSLTGAIADSQCAYNVHSSGRSHEWMIKKKVPGATDDKSCTLHCVKDMGGNYVLVVKDDVYRLDDQVYAERFAGMKVKITGTLDEKNTLHILTIEVGH